MSPSILPYHLRVLLAALILPLAAHAYFQVSSPAKGAQWANGQTYPVTWEKGLLDGVDTFDLELSRMSTDGLIFIAKDVPSTIKTVNVAFQSLPAADDYFLLFLNSTHGVVYGNSQQFSILQSIPSNATAPQPDANQPTVTVSGGPNPTAAFVTTFPPSANGAAGWEAVSGWGPHALALAGVVTAALSGGAWAVL
ncbi:hypothetical protein FA95DRAFT_1592839 [Auriscalpium vulgare]|uniref:Uncharacterized protein n=1 Tax=Auriscalpium vulgare TaxID=40419 RepID=A0ACB8S961_9AGAM|nr:hypothetical protein FA95DRAFT_1592839 [Auriscalpium vulgare]